MAESRLSFEDYVIQWDIGPYLKNYKLYHLMYVLGEDEFYIIPIILAVVLVNASFHGLYKAKVLSGFAAALLCFTFTATFLFAFVKSIQFHARLDRQKKLTMIVSEGETYLILSSRRENKKAVYLEVREYFRKTKHEIGKAFKVPNGRFSTYIIPLSSLNQDLILANTDKHLKIVIPDGAEDSMTIEVRYDIPYHIWRHKREDEKTKKVIVEQSGVVYESPKEGIFLPGCIYCSTRDDDGKMTKWISGEDNVTYIQKTYFTAGSKVQAGDILAEALVI